MVGIINAQEEAITNARSLIMTIPEVIAILRVGSSSREYVPFIGDLDFIAVTTSEIPENEILNSLNFLPGLNIEPNWKVIDGTFRGNISNFKAGIFLIHQEKLLRKIELLQKGHFVHPSYEHWTILGNAPEVFLADIFDGVIEYDNSGLLINLKRSLNEYPENLRKKLLEYVNIELTKKIEIVKSAQKRKDGFLYNVASTAIIFPWVRGLFSFHRQYFRGLKFLGEQATSFLPLPDQKHIHFAVEGLSSSSSGFFEIAVNFQSLISRPEK